MTDKERAALWRGIGKRYAALFPPRVVHVGTSYGGNHLQVGIGERVKDPIHYEWLLHDELLDVALHFEDKNASTNKTNMATVLSAHPDLGVDKPLFSGPFGPKQQWYALGYRLNCQGLSLDTVEEQAVTTMRQLMSQTRATVGKLM